MNHFRQFRRALLFALASVTLALPAGHASAEEGRVHLHIGKAGFIIGAAGGNGTLHFNGVAHGLSIGGMNVGLTIGVSSADLIGTAYNLSSASDIEGSYTSAESSLAFAAGGAGLVLQNANGVRLELHGNQVGFEASLDVGGMTISLK